MTALVGGWYGASGKISSQDHFCGFMLFEEGHRQGNSRKRKWLGRVAMGKGMRLRAFLTYLYLAQSM
jgi:hypothetical protein